MGGGLGDLLDFLLETIFCKDGVREEKVTEGRRGPTVRQIFSPALSQSVASFFDINPRSRERKLHPGIVLAIDASVVLHLADGMAHLSRMSCRRSAYAKDDFTGHCLL